MEALCCRKNRGRASFQRTRHSAKHVRILRHSYQKKKKCRRILERRFLSGTMLARPQKEAAKIKKKTACH